MTPLSNMNILLKNKNYGALKKEAHVVSTGDKSIYYCLQKEGPNDVAGASSVDCKL
jgi:hypothetical protein